jgi:Putative beta-barrel porin 2
MPVALSNKRPQQEMQLYGMRRLKLGLLSVLLALSPVAPALEIEPVVGAGLRYTDNAKLTEKNEDSDVILVGLVGADISESDGPFRADANTWLTYENYLDNTYGDKYWFNLNANAGWEMIRDRVDWGVRDYFSQTPINNLDSDTPSNLQNTNVFSLGPNISFPLSGRQAVTLRPLFTDFYYGESDEDNQQYGLNANWLYLLYPDTKVGIDGGATNVSYNKDDQFPDYTIYNLSGVVTGTRPRSQYRIEMGRTNISRDIVDNQSGFTGNLDWLYNITRHSSIRAYAATDLTDSSQQLLNSEIDPGTGDSGNVQTSGNVLRNRIFRMTYTRKDSTLNSNIWTEFRDLDYKESPDERKVKELGAELDYQVTALFTTGIFGTYNNTKQTDTSREDKRYATGVTARYRLSSKLSTRLDLQYRKKDSTTDTEEYTEYSAFLGLVYGLGRVPTRGRYGY